MQMVKRTHCMLWCIQNDPAINFIWHQMRDAMQSLYINNATVAQHQQQISGAQELFSALTPSLVRSEKTTKTTKQQQKKSANIQLSVQFVQRNITKLCLLLHISRLCHFVSPSLSLFFCLLVLSIQLYVYENCCWKVVIKNEQQLN